MNNDGHCTTILAGKNTTKCGHVIHGHNEDQGINNQGELWFVPRGIHKKGEKTILPHDIPYLYERNSSAYWASGNWPGGELNNNSIMGMNEWGVSLSANTMYSKVPHLKGRGFFPRALRRILLSQCRSARGCMETIAAFVERYGQRDTQDLAYCVADSQEAWVIEVTARHWAAKRCPDDGILVLANHFTIGDDYDRCNGEYTFESVSGKKSRILSLVDYGCKELGYAMHPEGKFSFRDAYSKRSKAEWISPGYNTKRVESVVTFLQPRLGRLTENDIRVALRNHRVAEDASQAPHQHLYDRFFLHTVCNNLTQCGNIWVPLSDEAGDMIWHYAPTSPCVAPFIPIIGKEFGNDAPEYSTPQQIFKPSFWDSFNRLRKYLIRDYKQHTSNYTKSLHEFEEQIESSIFERRRESSTNSRLDPFSFSGHWVTKAEDFAVSQLKQLLHR